MEQTVSNIDRARAVLVIAATLGTIGLNWMAAVGRLNGVTTGEISAMFPSVITPAGYAFAIWNLIYLGLVVFSIYQFLPHNIERFRPVRSLYIFSCALNCAWLFFWHNAEIGICLAVITALLVVLVFIDRKVGDTRNALESLIVRGAFGLYLGWVTAAALVNFAVFLVYANIELGEGAQAAGAALVLAAAAFAVLVRIKLTNYFVPLAVAWALTAIAVKQSGRTLIVAAAAVGVIACLIAALSFVLNLNRSEK